MNSRHPALMGTFLAAFILLAVGYSLAIPSGEGVDETSHFSYVKYVKERRQLPIQPVSRSGVEVWMGHHPPLYYVLGALSISWVDTSDFNQVFQPNPHFVWRENDGRNGWNVMLHFGQDSFPWQGAVLGIHVVRLMTVGVGTVALYAIYRAVQLLFPEHPWAPVGAAALVGFNPSFIFMSSAVHHDTLQAAIFGLAAWWAMRLLRESQRWYDAWIGGVLVGASCLTKLSGLALVPFVGIALLLRAWRDRGWRRLLPEILAVGTGAFLVSGWWFVRNQSLYGDPFGWQMFLQIHGHMVRRGPYTWMSFLSFLSQIGRTFWGAFGYMHITFPKVTKYLWWLSGLSGIGLIVGLLRRHISREHWREWLLLLALLGTLFASFVRFSITTVGAGHGRYLFPAGVTIGALLIAGLNGFSAWRHQRLVSIVTALGMVTYAVWLPTRYVLPKYASLDTPTVDQLARAQPAEATFGDTMRLLAYHSNTDLAIPGEWMRLDLYWEAIGRPEERLDPLVRVQLTDGEGQVLASQTGWPVPSLTPSVWSPGCVYTTRMPLKIPVGHEAGQVHLKVGALSTNGEHYLPARTQRREFVGSGLVEIGTLPLIGSVTEVSPRNVPNPRQQVFASELALRGFEIPIEPVSEGSTVSVVLYWEVLKPVSDDYTVFIHVLNKDGELVTQFDRPPGGGTAPTSTWQVGKTLRDTYPVQIPSDVPAGSLEIHVGMYTWPSLERLSVTVDGTSVGDSVRLGTIQIDSQ